jgi:hypothetical protein
MCVAWQKYSAEVEALEKLKSKSVTVYSVFSQVSTSLFFFLSVVVDIYTIKRKAEKNIQEKRKKLPINRTQFTICVIKTN